MEIHGCLQNGGWCDVSWRGKRGWVEAAALECNNTGERMPLSATIARSNFPVVAFEFKSYWDTNYKQKLWYEDRAKWAAGTPSDTQAAQIRGFHRAPLIRPTVSHLNDETAPLADCFLFRTSPV